MDTATLLLNAKVKILAFISVKFPNRDALQYYLNDTVNNEITILKSTSEYESAGLGNIIFFRRRKGFCYKDSVGREGQKEIGWRCINTTCLDSFWMGSSWKVLYKGRVDSITPGCDFVFAMNIHDGTIYPLQGFGFDEFRRLVYDHGLIDVFPRSLSKFRRKDVEFFNWLYKVEGFSFDPLFKKHSRNF